MRLFTPVERNRPVASLAARVAAKEALAKALGAPAGLEWQDVEVVNAASGRPSFRLTGTVAAAITATGAATVHLSLSHDPLLLNRPTGFRLPVRGVVPSAGAGFVVVLCGDMQRMPGLGRTPAFANMDLTEDGRIVGLY